MKGEYYNFVDDETYKRGTLSGPIRAERIDTPESLAGFEPPKYIYESSLSFEEFQWLMDNSQPLSERISG